VGSGGEGLGGRGAQGIRGGGVRGEGGGCRKVKRKVDVRVLKGEAAAVHDQYREGLYVVNMKRTSSTAVREAAANINTQLRARSEKDVGPTLPSVASLGHIPITYSLV
jgi:hypothetical protein